MKISIIIPVFNEEKNIANCLNSLLEQTYPDLEVIVVDDGSMDKTMDVLSDFRSKNPNPIKSGSKIRVLQQDHLGAGLARNLGAENASGMILVFVDADMVFEENFIEKLTLPIREGKSIGTFSKEEYVLNKDYVLSKCWNINKNIPIDKMHPDNYPDSQPVFRAILKNKFAEAGGFGTTGYIDDHTLADKLGVQASVAKGAVFYHQNPQTLKEVWQQARWIGKSEYKRRKIKNELLMKLISLIRYSLPLSLFFGLLKSIKYRLPQFLFFKVYYDLAIEFSLIKTFFGEQQYK